MKNNRGAPTTCSRGHKFTKSRDFPVCPKCWPGYYKKTKTDFKTIDGYIGTFPKEVQVVLEEVRQTIKKAAPEAIEAISYQMPTFKLHGKNLVHFAGWKNHIGFYPVPSGIKAFKKELSIDKNAKGSVQFPLNKPMPLELISKIVKFRVEENERENK